MWEENNEYEEYEKLVAKYNNSFKYRRRQKQMLKRIERAKKPEPSIKEFLLMRTAELLVPELIISLVISALITFEIIPSMLIIATIVLGVSLLLYVIYVFMTSNQLFWAFVDVKKYMKVNLGAYAVVVVFSVIMRMIDIRVFSWMFMPTKVLTLFGVSSWVSLLAAHGLNIIIMLLILFNAKTRRYFEMKYMGADM